MSARRRIWTIARTRRVVQIAVLILFVAAVFAVRLNAESPEPSPWLKGFFAIDPLVMLTTLVAAHNVPKILLWSLVTIGVTILLGRVFCGWICPLGTCHAAASRVLLRRKERKLLGRWSPGQRLKYYVLAAFLVGAVFGLHWINVLDPIVLLARTTATAVFPATQWAAKESSLAVYQKDPKIGSLPVVKVTDPAYRFANRHFFGLEGVERDPMYVGGAAILGLFVVTLALNRLRPRFWCRYICPTGALLGLFSWRPILRRKVNAQTCNGCDLCGMACHGAASAEPGGAQKPMECFACMDCSEACARGSLGFTAALPIVSQPKVESVDLSKRGLLLGAVGGLAMVGASRISPEGRGKRFNPALIRPPGSRAERDFLQRCLSCGLCMKICPTGGLQPTWTEAGLEGLWTPVLVPRIGNCDHDCVLCGQICPTEAIVPLTVEEKAATKIGLASFDVTRCIPYAYGRDCMVCEEHCPIPDKAIYCVEVEIKTRDGGTKTIKQPRVDPDKCTGCGICENVCPFKDLAGIRVTSANETRHPANQPILPGGEEDPYANM